MTAKIEYGRFLRWLREQHGVTEDARRVANIVSANFAAVEATSSVQGQRSRTLVPILLHDLAAESSEIPEMDEASAAPTTAWTRLRRLTVGPFRGFQFPESFDLDRQIVLIYGPNGSGKTSLCEALEFCLLGELEEAESKRIPHETYAQNLRAGRFDAPSLFASDEQGGEAAVVANLDAYQFCFIEKNRIEAFSRIASKTQAQRTELIAALFGLERFTDFVKGFNNDIDRQIALGTPKAIELEAKRRALIGDQALLDSEAGSDEGFRKQEASLAQEAHKDLDFEGLKTLLGIGSPGRLQELNRLVGEDISGDSGITSEAFEQAKATLAACATELAQIDVALSQRASEVHFRTLYEAIRGLRTPQSDRCPACETPLLGERGVVQDPFEKADRGLRDLAELAKLQDERAQKSEAVVSASVALFEIARRVADSAAERVEQEGGDFSVFELVPTSYGNGWHAVLDAPQESGTTLSQGLAEQSKWCESRDLALKARRDSQSSLKAELDRLNAINLKFVALQTNREAARQNIAKARARIEGFDASNAELILEVGAEAQNVAHHLRVQVAYTEFLGHLRAYRASLPSKLTADLSEMTLRLFNDFNRHDHESDRLATLTLPSDEAERISISYNSSPQARWDALQVLSEGHIRCLGLAILVAKNLKEGCPLLVFDDAVNAIDHEHRLGIRDTLFGGDLFKPKQIVLTCHGEELIKDIEVAIGRDRAESDCISYTFLPHTGDHVLRVVPSETRNYVLEAEQALAAGRVRNAVAAARRAMEAINSKAWSLLRKRGLGELKLRLESARSPLDQNNLASAIKSAFNKESFAHPQKTELLAGYTTMLEAQNWQVFNTGTHETAGIEDFDRSTVERAVRNLATLDALLTT